MLLPPQSWQPVLSVRMHMPAIPCATEEACHQEAAEANRGRTDSGSAPGISRSDRRPEGRPGCEGSTIEAGSADCGGCAGCGGQGGNRRYRTATGNDGQHGSGINVADHGDRPEGQCRFSGHDGLGRERGNEEGDCESYYASLQGNNPHTGGYAAGETVYRTKATGGDIPTAFSAIPYEHADAYSLSEFYGARGSPA